MSCCDCVLFTWRAITTTRSTTAGNTATNAISRLKGVEAHLTNCGPKCWLMGVVALTGYAVAKALSER
jgi:hypothetical protein